MRGTRMRTLRHISLFFLLLGFAGFLMSTGVSTEYLKNPRIPAAEQGRVIPRSIHGIVIYQTQSEDRRLTILEDGSVSAFCIGIALGLVYLRKWGIEYALSTADDETMES